MNETLEVDLRGPKADITPAMAHGVMCGLSALGALGGRLTNSNMIRGLTKAADWFLSSNQKSQNNFVPLTV